MTTIPLEIVTFDGYTESEERTDRIDFANPRDRSWFMRHQTWALNNGRGVTARPIYA